VVLDRARPSQIKGSLSHRLLENRRVELLKRSILQRKRGIWGGNLPTELRQNLWGVALQQKESIGEGLGGCRVLFRHL